MTDTQRPTHDAFKVDAELEKEFQKALEHELTDEDIAKRTSYAVKINAVTDAARPLKLKNSGRAVSETKRA